MKNIMNTLNNNYKVNGEDERYAIMYANEDEIIEEFYGDIERFEERNDVKANELHYPIITFDGSGILGGSLFESTETRENIMREAYEFFNLDNDFDGIWEFENYTLYEEEDMLRFENADNEVIGYVSNHDAGLQEDLNKGIDPIADGWEDGVGNTIGIDGWGDLGKQVIKQNNEFEMGM